ncbi:MAG: hypothetical protein ACI9DC_001694 [Gammaproteobacteria bacterium]
MHRCTRDQSGRGDVFEMLSIVCTAAALMQGGCIPDDMSINGEKKVIVPDGYEQMIAPGAFQLSYSGSGHDFDRAALTAHWNRRAAQLCAGNFTGQPVSQTQYPESGYEQMISATFLSGNRSFHVETYGVAYCEERKG